MSRGRLISFEGGEGAGKSSVIVAISQCLSAHKISHRLTREPGGTPFAEALRDALLHRTDAAIAPQAEVLAMFAARAQHVRELIEPALTAGQWVLTDRYTDASFAYQGGGRGIAGEALMWLEDFATAGLKPDRTYLLDVDLDEGRRRLAQRGGVEDRMERESDGFFARVRAAYLARAAAEPQRFRVIDARAPLAEVIEQVRADLVDLINSGGQ